MACFKVGQIVRYAAGSTALMRISYISEKHGGYEDRYFGEQFFGGTESRYESQIIEATFDELKFFELEEKAKAAQNSPKDQSG